MQDDHCPRPAAAGTDSFTGEQSKESTRLLERHRTTFIFLSGGSSASQGWKTLPYKELSTGGPLRTARLQVKSSQQTPCGHGSSPKPSPVRCPQHSSCSQAEPQQPLPPHTRVSPTRQPRAGACAPPSPPPAAVRGPGHSDSDSGRHRALPTTPGGRGRGLSRCASPPLLSHLPHAFLADALHGEHLLADGRQLHAAGGPRAFTGGRRSPSRFFRALPPPSPPRRPPHTPPRARGRAPAAALEPAQRFPRRAREGAGARAEGGGKGGEGGGGSGASGGSRPPQPALRERRRRRRRAPAFTGGFFPRRKTRPGSSARCRCL